MPTPAERRALAFLAILSALGVGARGFLARRDELASDGAARTALDRQIGAVDAASRARTASTAAKNVRGRGSRASRADSGGQRAGGTRGAASKAPKPTARAAASNAPKPTAGSVSGTAPGPLALYEARRRAVQLSNAEASARVAERTAELNRLKGLASAPKGGGREGDRRSPVRRSQPLGNGPLDSVPVDLDTADAEAIMTLPGIGPTLAARIVADRRLRGPFGSLEGLQRVKGIGPTLAGRINGRVTFSRRLAAPPTVTRFTFERPPALYP